MGENLDNKEKIEIKIDNTDSVIGWIGHILELIKEYGPFKIIGATILISFVSIFLYFAFNFTKAFELYDAWRERLHDEKMEQRIELGPKVQSLIDKLTYTVGASRTMVLELHNGNKGNGGLPFAKCTATYESLNLGIPPIAGQYQETNLTLMPFAAKLFANGYYCGNVEELEPIDRALYYRMKSNETEHFAACVIEGVEDKPIAFMFVSFNKIPEDMIIHNCTETRNMIRHISMELAVLLEVSRLMDKK